MRPWLCGLNFLGLMCLLLISGCGGGKPAGKVSGKVTFNGAPVTEAAIVFENQAAGVSAKVNLGPDGTYVAKTADSIGLPPGNYQVAVTPSQVAETDEVPLVAAPSGNEQDPPSAIPAKYHSPATSGLTADVKAGDNPPFDFDLKDE